jgi:putative protease
VGKVTNYFKRLGVAEVLIEAAPLAVGEPILWMGETTGCVEQSVGEIRLDLNPVQNVKQGDVCSIKVEGSEIRRGDKLYKEEVRE